MLTCLLGCGVVQVKDAFEKDRKERGVDSIQWR